MRAAMKVYDGGGPVSVPEAAGRVSVRSDEMLPMNGSQKEEEEGGVLGRKRKVFMVKNDEDSDGSEMSCSSLSSVEDDSPLLSSSAARTRPLTDSSPVLTKVTRRTKIAPTPRRSILKRTDSRNSTENPSPSPANSEMLSQKSDRILALETPTVTTSDKSEQLPAPLKRRRISWDIPGQGQGFQNEQENKETGENSSSTKDQISESLLCRVKG
jgi:hypothetical protein